MSLTCPYCGSTNLVQNPFGELVCASCGSVIDRTYSWDVTDYYRTSGLTLVITPKKLEYHMKKIQKESTNSHRKYEIEYVDLECLEKTQKNSIKSELEPFIQKININELISDERSLIAYDLVSRSGTLRTDLDRAIMALVIANGKEKTLKKLGKNWYIEHYVNRVIKKVNSKKLLKLKILFDKRVTTD